MTGREQLGTRQLGTLLRVVLAAGAVVVIGSVASIVVSGRAAPAAWQLALAAGLFFVGDTELFHIRFGQDQRSFTWSEAALLVGLALVPFPWLAVLAPAGVALAHIVARRAPVKVAFNASVCAIGVVVARGVLDLVAAEPARLDSSATWVALALAAGAFFVVNSTAVSAAVALSQGVSFRSVHQRDLALNLIVLAGNTALGVLLVAMAVVKPAMLALLPVSLVALYLTYWSYLRAMQERDTWELLETMSRELLATDRDRIAEVTLDRTRTILGADVVELVLVGEAAATATAFTSVGDAGITQRRCAWSATPAAVALAEGRQDPFPVAATEGTEAVPALTSAVVAPLATAAGPLGSLRAGYQRRHRLTARDWKVFTTVANQVSAALQHSQVIEELRHRALHDPLTGLPNRALLMDRVSHAEERSRRTGRDVAVLLLDIDRFKVINDSLGHALGDQMLVAVADRLRHCVRPGDTATRLGGDEFAVVCEDLSGFEEAVVIANRLLAHLRRPFDLNGRSTVVSASVGVATTAMASDRPYAEPSDLLRDADAAMYRAKDLGRDRCELFDQGMRALAVERLEIEGDLRAAVAGGQFSLHYQPIVDLRTNEVAFEALARWQHPVRGSVPPAYFVPVAEETGLINALGAWVLRHAVEALATGDVPRDAAYVSVNVSAQQLAEGGTVIVKEMADVLGRTGVAPDRVCIEVTESVLVDDVAGALDVLERLRALGVRVALDDFGTGYSSLSYLQLLPVDILKIDRSFVVQMVETSRDRAIVAGMLELAHTLGLRVVAEGVESDVQLRQLAALGCDAAQGFYLSPPAPAAELEAITYRDGAISPPVPA